MSVITLLVALALLGVVAWALVTYVSMPAAIKNLIVIVAVVVGVLYVLNAFGIGLPNLPTVPSAK